MPIFKVSPTAVSNSDKLFALYYNHSKRYALNFNGKDLGFTEEFIAEKWYTVRSLALAFSLRCRFLNLIQLKITQTKSENDKCNVKAWWQNELVVNGNFPCRNYDSGIGLYVAGEYPQVIDGQVRKFSFVKK